MTFSQSKTNVNYKQFPQDLGERSIRGTFHSIHYAKCTVLHSFGQLKSGSHGKVDKEVSIDRDRGRTRSDEKGHM